MDNQEFKADNGKPRVSLVPTEIIRNVAIIREYGLKKYGEKESWKSVEPERYRDAMYRHLLAYIDDPHGVDEESGLPHLWHLACNVAFLCELEKEKFKKDKINLKDFDNHFYDPTVIKSISIEAPKETIVSKDNVVDADGFDWKQGDYVSPADHMVQNVAKQQQIADKFKDTNGLVDEF